VIGRIIDTLECSLIIDRAASRPGIIGGLVLQGRVTELLDLEALVIAHTPNFYNLEQSA
jgi:hypothetical protein